MSQFNDPVPPYKNEIFCDGHGGVDGDHCCYLGEWGVCPHLVIRPDAQLPNRKYACGLYEQEGTWNKVYQRAEYQQDVQPFFDKMKTEIEDWNTNIHGCGDWPSRAQVNRAYADYQNGGNFPAFCCYSRKCKEKFGV